jgi:hypothetical protein
MSSHSDATMGIVDRLNEHLIFGHPYFFAPGRATKMCCRPLTKWQPEVKPNCGASWTTTLLEVIILVVNDVLAEATEPLRNKFPGAAGSFFLGFVTELLL